MRRMIMALLFTALAAAPAAAAPLAFDLGGQGLSVRCGERALVTTSRLVAVDPAWTQHRFYSRKAKLALRATGTGATAGISLSSNDPAYPFKLKEYSVTPTADGIRVYVEGALAEPLPTAMEYTAFVLPGNLLAGAQYQATLADGRSAEGRLPALPGGTRDSIPAFRALRLRTLAGTLRLNVEEGSPLLLVDRRGDTFEDQRCFWVGAQSVPVSPQRPFRHTVSLAFDPADALRAPAPLTPAGGLASPAEVADLKLATPPGLPLIPPPQERVDGTGVYAPAPDDLLWVAPGRGEEHGRLTRAAHHIVLERLRLPLKPSAARRRPARGIAVEVVEAGRPLPEGARVPERAEGYWLKADSSGVHIVGRDARGAFYGLQTLRFLPRDGKVPVVEIRDWPDYPLRGLHLLADDASLAFHGRLIEDLLAPLKMNHIVFEVEYAQWDATRELHRPWGMSKEQMRALLKEARENFIEVTPLLQTLGHCEWLFVDGKHRDWAEDPETPYAYDASNPEVRALMGKLVDEVLELFRPRFLHIGHDEVDMRGRYPFRPANVAKGAAQVVLDDILFFQERARQHGARLMMWHDMLITQAEGNTAAGGPPLNIAAIRPRLPKDIVLVDWQYTPREAYPEVPLLRRDGFDVVGASWNAPGDIEKLAAYGRDKGMLGMIETTWTGYHGNADALRNCFTQISAYVRAGDRFWNAGAAQRPAYDDGDLLSRLVPFEGRDAFAQAGRGRLLDLTPWANVPLAPTADPFGLGGALGLDALPAGPVRFGTRLFRVARREGAPAAVAVRSTLAPSLPERVDGIRVEGKAQGLLFLHTTPLFAAPGREIGRYVARYADGSEEAIPVRYDEEIACPAEDASYYLAVPAFTWQCRGRTAHLWAMEWRNPHPERPLASLSLCSAGGDTAPVLLAVSVVE